jgi:hemerythrin-like domain-containing protein
MKRHEALAPLSRDHHGSLILAQLLKKGAPAYKGLPTDNAGKARYAMQEFEQHIKHHFEQEEKMLAMVEIHHKEIEKLGKEIRGEHIQLAAHFHSLDDSPGLENRMDGLGRMLETHIRKEERELFPLLQQHCSESQLQQIHHLLH